MKYFKLTLILVQFIVLIFFRYEYLYSQKITQQVVSNVGGFHWQTIGSIQFNLGESIIEDYKNSYCHLQQGFEQGDYGILSVNTIENYLDIKVFPNPTKDFIIININNSSNVVYFFDLEDLTGKRLCQSNLVQSAKIDLGLFDYGVYILRIVNQNNLHVQSFKIIKHE